MTQTYLEVSAPKCSAENFDGEIVAINLDTGVYFSIRESAAAIWQDLVAGHSVEAIVGTAAAGDVALAAVIEAYIGNLQEAGLMRSATAPAVAPAERRAGPGLAPPELETFGDMQSLLLLDPVHEVDDQAGWPKPRED